MRKRKAAKLLLDFFATHEWTQGTLARRRDGTRTNLQDPTAYSFCVFGAAEVLGGIPHSTLREIFGVQVIGPFNDQPGMTKERIMGILRKAATPWYRRLPWPFK